MTRRSSASRSPYLILGTLLVLGAWAAGCGGQGAGDATPIPSTGVPVAAVGARGVDVESAAGGPAPTLPPTLITAPLPSPPPLMPPDPFAPPVSPPPVPPAPTSTGVPL